MLCLHVLQPNPYVANGTRVSQRELGYFSSGFPFFVPKHLLILAGQFFDKNPGFESLQDAPADILGIEDQTACLDLGNPFCERLMITDGNLDSIIGCHDVAHASKECQNAWKARGR